MRLRSIALAAALLAAPARADERAPLRPDALVDLGSADGAALVQAQWRTARAEIAAVDFREVGPDRKPSGPPNRTLDVAPRAGAADFDDSGWERIAATSLEERRGSGLLCAVWYRFDVVVPERVAAFDTRGCTAVLELVVDDYAEVWVDGRLATVPGSAGGAFVAGWNAPNRVVLGRDLEPGRRFAVAVLGINGPLSALPSNYVWIRSATVELFAPGRYAAPERVELAVDRRSMALDLVLGATPVLERLAGGFQFTEGPLWPGDGSLLFSDPNANAIYRWTPDEGARPWRVKSGYKGADVGLYGQPGSNGLAADAEGRVVICEHGNRRVTRLEKNGVLTVLADRYQGKRLNSPNDVVVAPDGSVFFTDPPFGLPEFHDDPRRELPFCGVFRWKDGALTLESDELLGPNGLAFSPDGRFLYVGNWDPERKVVLRFPVRADGRLGASEVLVDMTRAAGEEAIDGLKVDRAGRLWVSGPGGLWVLSPAGEHLGTLRCPEQPANFAFDGDGANLYLTARTGLYRLRLAPAGRSRAAGS